MSNGLHKAAIAMTGLERRLTTISENLANVSSPGFKRARFLGDGFQAELGKQGAPSAQKSTQGLNVDFTQGELVRTDELNDLALFGEGFFVLEGPQGEMFTRNGSFSVNDRGVLVNNEGFPVAWEQRPASITPVGEAPLEVNPQGEVYQGDNLLGRLRIADFEDKQMLTPTKEGYLEAPRGAKEIPSLAVVHQGTLEASNAVGIKEIVGMIEVQRSFEQMARLVSSINESYDRLTRSF